MKQNKMKKIIMQLVLVSLLVLVLGAVSVHAATDSTTTGPVIQVDLLNQDPDPARSGDTVDLRFKIENTGGKAVENMNVELLQDYPFTVVSGEAVKSLGTINAGQTGNDYVTLAYTVKIDKDNIQAQREVRFRYKYDSADWITESFVVNIASKEFAQIIFVDKAKLAPGQETSMTFTITNVGSAPLQNMVFSWQEPTGAVLPVYSGDTKYVKYLDVGQSVDLAYIVIADVNANPGLYTLNLNLKSESLNNATPQTLTTKAGVFIGGETDFDVAFSESSAGQTSLSVSNTGNNPAQSVSVKIPQQAAFRVSGSNSAIIGNLDKGDYTLVSFQIVSATASNFSSQGAQGRQPSDQNLTAIRERLGNSTLGGAGNNPNNLRVIIDYTDTTGERRSVEKNVTIQFRSITSTGTTATGTSGRAQASSSFIGSTLFWILIIVIIVVAGFFVFRNQAKKAKILELSSKKR